MKCISLTKKKYKIAKSHWNKVKLHTLELSSGISTVAAGSWGRGESFEFVVGTLEGFWRCQQEKIL